MRISCDATLEVTLLCSDFRAEVVAGEVQVVGGSASGKAAQTSKQQGEANESFEMPAQLRQQFIEVISVCSICMCQFLVNEHQKQK